MIAAGQARDTGMNLTRRHMLLGLATASTAAAIPGPTKAAPAENPRLLELSDSLPATVAAHKRAADAYRKMDRKWVAATPWAPDEITELGTCWPHKAKEPLPGRPEMKALGGFLWRVGDEYPRRIVVTAAGVRWKLNTAKAQLRRAKKARSTSDAMQLEDEVQRLKRLLTVAETYEVEFSEVERRAKAYHQRLYPFLDRSRAALEQHVAAIMNEDDFTMEGVVIKAQALAAWDRNGDRGVDKIAIQHGLNWHGQIAASIIRHAQGGAS